MTHLGDITPRNVPSRGIRSQFFRLRSCSKIFESGSENFSNLGIRLLFTLRLMFLLEKSPRRLLLLLKLKSDSESVFFSQIFYSWSERKTQNPAVSHSRSVAASGFSSLFVHAEQEVILWSKHFPACFHACELVGWFCFSGWLSRPRDEALGSRDLDCNKRSRRHKRVVRHR